MTVSTERTIDNSLDVGRKIPGSAIADDAITADKLAPGAVDVTDVADLAITTAKLAAGALSADAAGRSKMATALFDEATVSAKFAAQAIDSGVIKNAAITTTKILDGNVTTLKLPANVLSADATGRARIETNFFDEATVDDLVAAGAIDGSDRIKAASVITDRLAPAAVTGPKIGATPFSVGAFAAGNGAGARTLTGAVAGDRVVGFANVTTTGALGTAADFEATITVDDQIQQLQTDHTAQEFVVFLLPAAA
jgi:hypothetical protein